MGMRQIGRRGLVAGLAALAGAALGKGASPSRVEAGHTSLNNPEPLHIGVINDGTNATNVETATSIVAETVVVSNTTGNGSAAVRIRQLGTLGDRGWCHRHLGVGVGRCSCDDDRLPSWSRSQGDGRKSNGWERGWAAWARIGTWNRCGRRVCHSSR